MKPSKFFGRMCAAMGSFILASATAEPTVTWALASGRDPEVATVVLAVAGMVLTWSLMASFITVHDYVEALANAEAHRTPGAENNQKG